MKVLPTPARVRLLPRVVRDARAEAAGVLAHARREAARVLEDARQQAAAVRAEAHREGREAARAEAAGLLGRAVAERARALEGQSSAVATLAVDVARTILGREALAGPEVLRDVVQRALARMRRARRLVLRVHPDDLATAQAQCRAWLPPGLAPDVLDIEADGAVGRGGVVIESDVGRLDGRLETQLAAIARALTEP